MRIKTSLAEGKEISIGQYRIWREEGCICSDRSKVFPDIEKYHTIHRTPSIEGTAELTIYVSPNLIEIFVNDGYYVMSTIVYGNGRKIAGNVWGVSLLDY